MLAVSETEKKNSRSNSSTNSEGIFEELYKLYEKLFNESIKIDCKIIDTIDSSNNEDFVLTIKKIENGMLFTSKNRKKNDFNIEVINNNGKVSSYGWFVGRPKIMGKNIPIPSIAKYLCKKTDYNTIKNECNIQENNNETFVGSFKINSTESLNLKFTKENNKYCIVIKIHHIIFYFYY